MKNFLWIILVLLPVCSYAYSSNAILYGAPEQEKKSNDFKMFVDNKPLFVHQARVSKFPVNQIWPGYQRPVNQTEIASFASFDFKGEAEIKINSNEKIKTLKIRPLEYGIKPVIKGNTIQFKVSKPSQIVVEVNGYHHALHIFANPIENYRIDKKDPRIHYFGPGIHEAGVINVKSNETVFIDGGAVVYGVIKSENARNVRIIGRGILDASKIERGKATNLITLKNVENAYINGIILRDPQEWAVVPTNCNQVTFDNIKLIGFWRYNSDGIDVVSCKNITIKNSFIRSYDDNIVIRGTKGAYHQPYNIIENISINNCVLWNDWGRVMELGASTVIDTMKNISFSNCFIPHFTSVAMDIQNCDRGYVKDIHFKNIAIEDPISDSLRIGTTPIVKRAWGKIIVLGVYGSYYSDDTIRGNIENIYFNNIRYNSKSVSKDLAANERNYLENVIIQNNYDKFIRDNIYYGDIPFNCFNPVSIYLSGYDNKHIINNIFIKDYYINGKKMTDLQKVGKNEFVKNVFIN